MKKAVILFISILYAAVISCSAPDSLNSTKSLSKTVLGKSIVKQPANEGEAVDKKVTAPDKGPSVTEPVVSAKLPLEPSNLNNNTYFGIRVLQENEDPEDNYSDRRLTIKFSIPRGTANLKANFGDADKEEESKKAQTKTDLDVKIEGMFITLTDKGQEFLKLEVSKDFQFMFITKDNIQSKPVPNVNYEGTGLALNGEEWHGKIPGGYNGPILPKLPTYPFVTP